MGFPGVITSPLGGDVGPYTALTGLVRSPACRVPMGTLLAEEIHTDPLPVET